MNFELNLLDSMGRIMAEGRIKKHAERRRELINQRSINSGYSIAPYSYVDHTTGQPITLWLVYNPNQPPSSVYANEYLSQYHTVKKDQVYGGRCYQVAAQRAYNNDCWGMLESDPNQSLKDFELCEFATHAICYDGLNGVALDYTAGYGIDGNKGNLHILGLAGLSRSATIEMVENIYGSSWLPAPTDRIRELLT